MRTLYHVTLRRNLRSIKRKGLKRSYSTGKRQAVWLVEKECQTWAAMHVAKRHGVRIDQLIVLTVQVPAECLYRGSANTYYSTADVPPESIITVAAYALVSL
jgi:RNA:NAD 2'-phosphotransferase (TPT1/KptA family)